MIECSNVHYYSYRGHDDEEDKAWHYAFNLCTLNVNCFSRRAETDTNTSANPADAGKITLELWDWWGDGTHKAVIEQIVSDFNASQDKIVVKHVHYPWGDVWTKALAATAAGNPPDIVIQDINSVPTRADAKQSMDLRFISIRSRALKINSILSCGMQPFMRAIPTAFRLPRIQGSCSTIKICSKKRAWIRSSSVNMGRID